jgi:hypothetical protein
MFNVIFYTVLRTIAIPIVLILILQNSFLGPKGAILAVTLSLTIVNILSIIWQVFKLLGNTMLLKGGRVLKLSVRILIEVITTLGFWIYFFGYM